MPYKRYWLYLLMISTHIVDQLSMIKRSGRTMVQVEFKIIQLFKEEILGQGSYGRVCKAECDGLLCAAKVMHETLVDPTAIYLVTPWREHRLPMRRFEQECEFLSIIRHPNIIQYLGMYRDPDTCLPVLLMELMDDSLTHFLESYQQLIPYHIQVNICHDITLALSFLHSSGIVHRDLSSNNVLMIGNIRAKVTDFGMARLRDMNPRATNLTLTLCPGTDVYMPPEAIQDKRVYTEKIDCFSFGVIAVQIMTRLFPQPGDQQKDGIVPRNISERERRQNHISKIDRNHPLLAIALNCLKDRNAERPSALELCQLLATLKSNSDYCKSARLADDIVQQEYEIQKLSEWQNEEIQLLKREKEKVIEELKRQLEEIKNKRIKAQERVWELESQLWKQ